MGGRESWGARGEGKRKLPWQCCFKCSGEGGKSIRCFAYHTVPLDAWQKARTEEDTVGELDECSSYVQHP